MNLSEKIEDFKKKQAEREPGTALMAADLRNDHDINMAKLDRDSMQDSLVDFMKSPNDVQVDGESIKGDIFLATLFGPLAKAGEKTADAYRAGHDTPFSCSTEYYTSVVEELGFEKVAEFEIDRSHSKYNQGNETLYIYARPDGIILKFDTFKGDRNGAHIIFQLRAKQGEDGDLMYPTGCSGSVKKGVWIGDKDAREGLRASIRDLEHVGQFTSPMSHSDFSLRNCLVVEQDYSSQGELHGLEGSENFQERSSLVGKLQQERMAQMPKWFRQMAGIEDDPSLAKTSVPQVPGLSKLTC